jgi:hypothetical protein
MSAERIWYEDLGGFLTNDNYYRIVPGAAMTLEEKLNALVRFFIYLGALLTVVKADTRFLFFGIVAGLISIALYELDKQQRGRAERFLAAKKLDIVDNKVCARSTVDNPFMNPSLLDIHNTDVAPPCSLENDRVRETVERNFEARLFRDVGDLWGKMSSQRQFYTVPLHDQGAYAEWLYGRGPSCKEGNGEQCMNNLIEDVQRRPGQSSSSS